LTPVPLSELWSKPSRLSKDPNRRSLPGAQPTKFDFIISLRTAKDLGLTIPLEVLMRVEKVIKWFLNSGARLGKGGGKNPSPLKDGG